MYITAIVVFFFLLILVEPIRGMSGWPHRSSLLRTPTTPRLFRLQLMVECCPVWNLCGSIKLLLNGRPRALPRLDDLSAGRQARQQSERKHLNSVHVSFTACRHRPEKNKGLWCIQEERDSAPPPAYLPYHWDPGSQDGAYMHRW